MRMALWSHLYFWLIWSTFKNGNFIQNNIIYNLMKSHKKVLSDMKSWEVDELIWDVRADWLCFKSKWDKKTEESHSYSHLPVIKSSASSGGWTGLTLPSHFCPGATSVNISEMCRPHSLLLLLLSSLVTRSEWLRWVEMGCNSPIFIF